MPTRPCLGVDDPCGRLTTRPDSRCPTCASIWHHRRGSRQQRGYGREYEKQRERALAGATHCATCGQRFTPDNPATGGHRKAIRHGGTANDGVKAECRRCNYGWSRSGS